MFANIINTIPPITRLQLIIICTFTFLVSSESVSKYDMYFNLDRIFAGQIWRFITGWMFFKEINMIFLLKIYVFVQLSSNIQKTAFKRGSIDHLYFLLMFCIGLWVMASFFSINYLTNIYFYTLHYFYGRINSNQMFLINLFIPVRAPYIVWLILMIEWVIGDPDFKGTIVSIFLGHTLFFISNIYPKLKFSSPIKDIFDTPKFIVDFLTPILGRNIQDQIPMDGDDQILF